MTVQPFLGSTLLNSHEEGPRKGGPNTARSLLPEWVTATVRHLSCGQKFCISARKPFQFANWNVRTLLDNEDTDRPAQRTALIATKLCRYDVDIAALSETRLADEGSLSEAGGGYTFVWKGLPQDARRMHGIGFATRSSLLAHITESPVGINERLKKDS